MLKEKWQRLLLREKVLLISGISVILSILLLVITSYCMVAAITFFLISVSYNMYKFIKMTNVSISKAMETDIQKGQDKLKEGKIISGAVKIIALPLAFGIGIPMVVILLVYLWITAI